jgi:hypothetical protein
MKFDPQKLYELLPMLYRIRDAELAQRQQQQIAESGVPLSGDDYGPLRALLEVIGKEVEILEENIDQLYDDFFIETSSEWVVDYIGQLIGYRSLISIPGFMSQRASVANTIALRRRKGTATSLEQIARDVTNYDANIVEYFQLLATTQYMNHPRLNHRATPRITGSPGANASDRAWENLEYIGTPFDKIPRTADVRSIALQRGKYNIPNIGIYLWRIKNYGLNHVPAYKVDDNRYKFSVLGKDTQLYNKPEPEKTITQLAQRQNVPMPISRREFQEDLDSYYGQNKSILIELNGSSVPPDLICVCALDDKPDNSGDWIHEPTDKMAIDPKLGRIAFPSSMHTPLGDKEVYVSYHYGFSADMGGGSYNREPSFREVPNGTTILEVDYDSTTIQNKLNQLPPEGGLLLIKDNECYDEDLSINLNPGSTIEIRAKDGMRPAIKGSIDITGNEKTKLILNGLLIFGGDVSYDSPSLESNGLKITHCTLAPNCDPPVELVVNSAGTELEITHSITGKLCVSEEAVLEIYNSIIDAADYVATAIGSLSNDDPGGKLSITNSTVIGKVQTRFMELASNTIFWADTPLVGKPLSIQSLRLQEGCVRFSYFPERSSLPRPFRCQPQLSGDPLRVVPSFRSLDYGKAGYCQLMPFCAREITEGADDEAEMGAFHNQYQPQKISNLQTRLDEYMRFGMEAGIFLAS